MQKDQGATLDVSQSIAARSPSPTTLSTSSIEMVPYTITTITETPSQTDSLYYDEHISSLQQHTSYKSTKVSNHKLFAKVHDVVTSKFTKRFPKFKDLPVELRLQIWAAALPEPRVHELCLPNLITPKNRRVLRSNNNKSPAILHACRESRHLALKHLELLEYIPPPHTENDARVYAIKGFYFHPKIDTLYINHMADGILGYSFYLDYFDNELPKTLGLMDKWEKVALDSQWLALMSFRVTHEPTENRFHEMFPSVKDVTVVWDKRWLRIWHVRKLAWPGKTCLVTPKPKDLDALNWYWLFGSTSAEEGTRQYMMEEYGDVDKVPHVRVATVKRERFMIRRDLRITIRIASLHLGLRHLGPLRRI